jgi:hypothetical protein
VLNTTTTQTTCLVLPDEHPGEPLERCRHPDGSPTALEYFSKELA